jgi:hypothetical protein
MDAQFEVGAGDGQGAGRAGLDGDVAQALDGSGAAAAQGDTAPDDLDVIDGLQGQLEFIELEPLPGLSGDAQHPRAQRAGHLAGGADALGPGVAQRQGDHGAPVAVAGLEEPGEGPAGVGGQPLDGQLDVGLALQPGRDRQRAAQHPDDHHRDHTQDRNQDRGEPPPPGPPRSGGGTADARGVQRSVAAPPQPVDESHPATFDNQPRLVNATHTIDWNVPGWGRGVSGHWTPGLLLSAA